MLQGHTMAIVPCSNPTPKKLPTGGGEWPTFRTARAQRTVRPLGGVFALRAHCALLLDYVPPEEPPSTPLGNALRIR